MNLPFQPPLAPMEAKSVDGLPGDEGWQHEPKWDGFRAICFRDGPDVYISSRKELPFSRYFPEVGTAVGTLSEPRFVLDGEIVIFTPDGRGLDFDSLQLRLHPAASRVARLSRDTPASFVGFDLLSLGDRDPCTRDREVAERWLDEFVVEGLDGVVSKRLDSPYRSGEREMRKVKRIRTADCVVIGFRWAKDQEGEAVGSLLLGLYGPDGELHQVGFTSGFSREERRALLATLEPHREGRSEGPPPGTSYFSRWNREKDMTYEVLRPELVAEVGFDQVTGHRIRHGSRFVRWRHDKPADQCTFEQLERPATADLERLLQRSVAER